MEEKKTLEELEADHDHDQMAEMGRRVDAMMTGATEPKPRFTSRPAMIEVVYRCQNPKCQAVDRGRYFPNEPVAAFINCWKCGAGRGKEMDVMVQTGQCMKAFSMGPEDGDQERITEINKVSQVEHKGPGPRPVPGQQRGGN